MKLNSAKNVSLVINQNKINLSKGVILTLNSVIKPLYTYVQS